jgi:hypothetical protein
MTAKSDRLHEVLMSARNFLSTFLTVGILIVFISCKEEDNERSTQAKLGSALESNTWKVTYFFDTEDESHHFTDYVFTFNDDQTVAAARGTDAVNGTWSVSTSSNGTLKLILDFGVTEPFEDLNDDWDVVLFSNELVQLQDAGGGSAETDFLTLEKIQ